MNKCPWYNTDIFSKLNVKLFEDFIKHTRADRYHLMCSRITHDREQPLYEDEEIIIGDRPMYKSATEEPL